MTIDIVDLKTAPQHLPQLARWHHAQWAQLNPGLTLVQRIASMQPQLSENLVPSTWVAIDGAGPVGSASLLEHDMDTHPELSPWLASVFVAPPFRGRGIASQLVRRVMQEARSGGIDVLHLFTPDQAPLYAKLGWQVWREEIYMGETVALMRAHLCAKFS